MNVGMLIGGPRSNLALIHSEGEVSLYFFFARSEIVGKNEIMEIFSI